MISIFILYAPFKVHAQQVSEKTALTGALYYAQEVFGPLVHRHTQIFRDFSNTAQVYVFLFSHPDAADSDAGGEVSSDFIDRFDETAIVTVVAGANKTHVPVLQMYRGFPDYVLHLDAMKRFLLRETSKEDWYIARYVCVSSFELYLDWQSPTHPGAFLLRASDLHVMEEGHLMEVQEHMKRSRVLPSNDKRVERIRKKWEFVESLCTTCFEDND